MTARAGRRRRVRAWTWIALLGAAVIVAGTLAYRAFALPRGDLFERAPNDVTIRLEPVAGGFLEPVYVARAFDGTGALYVVEKGGRVWRVVDGVKDPTPFLDISASVITDTWERGAYSLAFHPGYPRDPRVFVAYTAQPDGRLVVQEHRVDAATGRAAGTPERTILEVAKPTYPNGDPIDSHNGGQIAFGPADGYLYISLGDGTRPMLTDLGSQNLGTLWGSVLRIDVDAGDPYAVPADNPFVGRKGARPEIWAYGLRNPWRFTFDPDGRTLWVSDVGQNSYEEIDRVLPGRNYGWPLREGRLWSLRDNVKAMGVTKSTWYRIGAIAEATEHYVKAVTRRLTPPFIDYGQTNLDPTGGQAVVAGYVYRGSALPALTGRFIYGDFVTGRIWSLTIDGERPVRRELLHDERLFSSFGEGIDGELFVTDYASGTLFRLEPAPPGGA